MATYDAHHADETVDSNQTAVIASTVYARRTQPIRFWIIYRDWTFLAMIVGDKEGETRHFLAHGSRRDANDRTFISQFDEDIPGGYLYGAGGMFDALRARIEAHVAENPEGKEVTVALAP